MRTLFSIFFLMVLAGFSLSAQPQVTTAKEGTEAKPAIEFPVRMHDFGKVKSGDQAFYYFVFTNSGEAPLVISNVRSSCGCTVPQWPRVPILGGQSDSIRVEYNTRIKGSFNKTITVFSNATGSGVGLVIKGNVTD
ncbi:MAG TPA: DUF1573 domain-containing protein [Prolixibacteraceae bacterium]|nr:DUF1573 domain-containing protein [Bacteroidales bacterium]HRV88892.1 DUF1573 domain-containing protein [Prolixibacteraceae bacterium]